MNDTQQKAAAIESKVREVCRLRPIREDGWTVNDIHLEHVLKAMTSDAGNLRTRMETLEGLDYDISKSFFQNLEDEDLCNYLYKLICE